MNLEEMKRRKKELGYSNKRIAELSGVPLGTVQKIFSGATKSPREDSLKYIWQVLARRSNSLSNYTYEPYHGTSYVGEGSSSYTGKDSMEYDQPDEPGIPDVIIDSRTRNWRRQGTYTIADVELLPEDFRVELIDGVLYDPETPFDEDVFALAAPMQRHQMLVVSISSILNSYAIQKHPECAVFVAPASVRLEENDTSLVEPDIFVVCDKSKLTGKLVEGAPDLVIEVLSRSTHTRDATIKMRKYWRAGVREYWIVDPFNEEVIVYHFEDGTPPDIYGFTDTVPVGISGGELSIDFGPISERMKMLFD